MAHWRRRGRRLRTIKGPTYGRLACRPAAHKRLWTVLARTAPLPPTTWRLAVAVTNLFRRWICLMSPSCLPVVTWGYPVWGWSEVDPVIARRFTNLLTVDGRQSSCLATSFSERLPKSIPTDLFDKHWHLIHCNAGVQTENCYVFQVGTSSNLPNAKRMMKFCLNLGRQGQKGVFCMLHVQIRTFTASATNSVLLKFLFPHDIISPQALKQKHFFPTKIHQSKVLRF